jgi:hypothetical protein
MARQPRQERPTRSALPPIHESFLPRQHPLHRPRHGARQRAARTCAVIFLLLPLASLVFGVRATPFENRPLVPFPSLDGWSFFTGLTGWATDHLPLRQNGVQAENWVSRTVFGEPPPRGQSDNGSPLRTLPPADANPSAAGISQYATVLHGSAGWLYLGQDVADKCRPTMDQNQVIAALRRLRQVVVASGRQFVLVVAPEKSTMMPQYLPADFVGKSCWQAATSSFWSRVDSQAGNLDVRPALRSAATQSGQLLYDKIDTRWTFQGGLIMTYALADRLQPGITGGWVTQPTTISPWPADLAPLLGQRANRQLTRYQLAPDGHADRTDYVGSDFRKPLKLLDPPGTAGSGQLTEPTGVIADSFTEFASPFLAAAFTNLTIVHPDTISADPAAEATALLADKKVVVLELAERDVAGGQSPILRPSVISAIGQSLAAHPMR